MVILDNISSEYIHQAIIILKSYQPEKHEKIIEEAEKIVSSYFDRDYCKNDTSNHTKSVNLLKSAVGILSFCLCVSLYFAFCK